MHYKAIKQAEMDLEANSGQPDGELSPGIADLGMARNHLCATLTGSDRFSLGDVGHLGVSAANRRSTRSATASR